jgi:hypothetical protein
MSNKKRNISEIINNCELIPTIKQKNGTCWLNSILTCFLYGDKSKILFENRLYNKSIINKNINKKFSIQKKFIKDYNNDNLVKNLKNYNKYLKYKYYISESNSILHDIFNILKKLLNTYKLNAIKKDEFDPIVNLMINLYFYDSFNFHILPKIDNSNLYKMVECGNNIFYQIKYIINLANLFYINITILEKTSELIKYKNDIYLYKYKYFKKFNSNNPNIIIIIDNTKIENNVIIENIKFNRKYYKLDSFKLSQISKKETFSLHAISCIKCNKNYYISDSMCDNLLNIDINNKLNWFINKCNNITYDVHDNANKRLYNLYKGYKIYFYLEEKEKCNTYLNVKTKNNKVFLVPDVILNDSSSNESLSYETISSNFKTNSS